MKKKYPENIVLCIVKPLYDLVKVENHWFVTYLDHYQEKLGIEILFYDICLLITKDNGKNFGIVGIQIDDTFNVRMEAFMKKEETDIIKTKLKAKI